MAAINVDLGKDSYTIEIERGLIHRVGEKIRALTKAEKIAVITDDHVEPLYGNTIRTVLTKAGFDVRVIAIPAGETSKNLQVLSDVYDGLSEFDMSRSDAIVTLSGGVPGDLGGFAAATYMRGIPFFQIPTTILAQIDSSVGGKVAVDLFERSAPREYAAILMDIQMPIMDGLDAARTIRALPREDAASIPIFALSASVFAEDVERSLCSGMNGHLGKPVDIDQICSMLQTWLYPQQTDTQEQA